MAERKFYWLKLNRNFFKRHDIRIIERLPDGRGIVLFYLELLAESVDHEGFLRYSEKKPYTAEMLASVTANEVELVEKALSTLEEYELIEFQDDGTIYLPELHNMLGFETDWARKKREWRDKKGQREDNVLQMSSECPHDVLTMSDKSKIKIKSIDIDKREIIKRKVFSKPTLEEISAYCQERNNSVDAQRFFDYYEAKGWVVGKSPMKDWKAAVRTWERNETEPKTQPQKKYGIDPDYFLQKAREEDARSGRS